MTPRQVARRIVDDIIADLSDRRDIGQEWDNMERDQQQEIASKWMDIAEREIMAWQNRR